MVFFGAPKLRGRLYGRHYGPPVDAGFFERVLGRFGGGFLLGCVKEDHRAVLRAYIRTLPVRRGWIVIFPEHAQQVLVGNFGRIEFHLHHFRVAGVVRANVLIGGLGERSSHIADGSGGYAFDLAECSFHAPKTSGSKRGLFHAYSLPPPG